jgi:hypothetical protein
LVFHAWAFEENSLHIISFQREKDSVRENRFGVGNDVWKTGDIIHLPEIGQTFAALLILRTLFLALAYKISVVAESPYTLEILCLNP